MSNDPTSRRPATRSGNTGAPMGSTISIAVAVIAVIVGFLILKNIQDDGKSTSTASPSVSGVPSSTSPSSSVPATPSITSPPTTAVLTTAGAIVIVANASNINGSAKQFSEALGKVSFQMGTPTNAAGAEVELPTSKVYFLPGGEAVAQSVAQALGGVEVAPMPTPVPTKDGNIGDATVLVMLGKDLAGKALPILDAPVTTTTVASAATAPLSNTTTTGL